MSEAHKAIRAAGGELAPISLAEVLAAAELQSRVDRKYLVTPAAFAELTRRFRGDLQVLEIEGRRDFRYESVYFDTPDLRAYHLAATGRRSKFKVRTRTYVDSEDCMLEVKTEGGRGETVKERTSYPLEHRDRLDPAGLEFVGQRLGRFVGVADLVPVLRTDYSRMTLVDSSAGTRVTCDAGLVCTAPGGAVATLDNYVLVEVKSPGGTTAVDRALWSMGTRPESISKYCVGLAVVHPRLPANRWNRTLRRYFGWQPGSTPVAA